MATLVCFHAHPDDESIATGGLMALASDAGHRVVLVVATRGEQGEPVPGVLADGEELWERRVVETAESADVLGADAPRFLGYRDSGMMGEPTNDDPTCFWRADTEEAAARLAAILTEVSADVLTVYDDHGGYGHPDHIQVHRVGLRAAELAGTPHVYESTMNRTRIQDMIRQANDDPDLATAMEDRPDPEEMAEMGTPAEDIAFEIDVRSVLDRKRASMEAHASQIPPDSFFLAMPKSAFADSFGLESFNRPGVTGTGGPEQVPLLPGL